MRAGRLDLHVYRAFFGTTTRREAHKTLFPSAKFRYAETSDQRTHRQPVMINVASVALTSVNYVTGG